METDLAFKTNPGRTGNAERMHFLDGVALAVHPYHPGNCGLLRRRDDFRSSFALIPNDNQQQLYLLQKLKRRRV